MKTTTSKDVQAKLKEYFIADRNERAAGKITAELKAWFKANFPDGVTDGEYEFDTKKVLKPFTDTKQMKLEYEKIVEQFTSEREEIHGSIKKVG